MIVACLPEADQLFKLSVRIISYFELSNVNAEAAYKYDRRGRSQFYGEKLVGF
jgi:hypothetical protein